MSLVLIALSACEATGDQAELNPADPSIGMLQHTVYFYLNDDITSDEIKQFEIGLKQLVSINEVHKAQIGVPGSTEERDVTDHSFSYSIIAWFETLEEYQVYADHPDHLEFIDTFSHLWADVKVYDSEIVDEVVD
ncbi:MAG: Dabb family protein [Balneolaceae bacterium]